MEPCDLMLCTAFSSEEVHSIVKGLERPCVVSVICATSSRETAIKPLSLVLSRGPHRVTEQTEGSTVFKCEAGVWVLGETASSCLAPSIKMVRTMR